MLWVEENQNRVDIVLFRIWFEGFIGKKYSGDFLYKNELIITLSLMVRYSLG